MRKRSGQAHGIDQFFLHRPKGSMAVPCPACPEPGVNMEEGWDLTDEELRFVFQTFLRRIVNNYSQTCYPAFSCY